MSEEASLSIILRARDEASAVLKENENALLGIGKAAVAVGAVGGLALAGMAVEATHLAANFQYTTQTLVTGAGEDQKNLELIRKGILSLAGEVGQTPQKLAEGMYMIESAGFHGAEGLKVLDASARTATVGAASMESVSDALTSALNAYHLPADKAREVTDKLLTTVAQGKMHMTDLASNIGKVLPVASLAGISLDQVAAATATMTMQGTDAAVATTGLRFLMNSLLSPTKQAQDTMKTFGLSALDVATALREKGLSGALEMITDHVGKKFPVGSQQYIAALDHIVGGTRGMTAALELTGQNMKTFKDNVNAISHASDGAGKTMEGWKEHSHDFNIVMERLRAGLEAILIRIADRWLPLITQAAQTMVDWLPKIQATSDSIINGLDKAITVLGDDLTKLKTFITDVSTELDKHKGRYEVLAGFIAAFVTPTLIAMGTAFAVNVVTGIISTTTALIANTLAWIDNAFWTNVSNAYLIIYYARAIAVGAATAVWTGIQAAHNAVMAIFALIQERGVAGTLAYLAVTGAVRVATFLWTAAQWLLNVALSMNPIGLVILAIAALVAGVIFAYQHSEAFRNIVNGLWDAIERGASSIWNYILPPLERLWSMISNVAGAVGGLLGNLAGLSNVHLPDLHIPGFATGGVIRHGGGGMIARIGEGNEDEVVATMSQVMAAGMAAGGGGGDGGTYVIQLQVDGKQMAQVVGKHMGRQFRLQGGGLGSGA